MPDPQSQRRYSHGEFAAAIRTLYPELAGVADDGELTHAVVSTHPEFRQHVIDPLEGQELAGGPPALPEFGKSPAKPPNPVDLENPAQPRRLGSAKTGGAATQPPPGESFVDAATSAVIGTPIRGAGKVLGGMIANPADGPMPPSRRVASAKTGGVATEPEQVRLAKSAADILTGGMEMATPVLPEALAEHTVETLAAIGAGSVFGAGGHAAAAAAGAPPDVAELVGAVGAVAGGGLGAHVAGAPGRATMRGAREQIAGEKQAADWDVAREARLQEGFDTTDAQTQFEVLQQQAAVLDTVRADQQQKFDALLGMLEENRRLDALAKEHASKSPFQFLDEVTRPAELPPGPPEPLQLGPATGEEIAPVGTGQPVEPWETGTRRATILGAPPDANMELVGSSAPRVAQSAPPAVPQMIDEIGNLLGQQLEYQPQDTTPRVPEQVRTRGQVRVAERQAHMDAAGELLTHLEEEVHPQAYYEITGNGKPGRETPTIKKISEITRAYIDSGRMKRGSDLTPAIVKAGAEASGYKRLSAFRELYDQWVGDVVDTISKRAEHRRMEAEAAAEPPAPSPHDDPFSTISKPPSDGVETPAPELTVPGTQPEGSASAAAAETGDAGAPPDLPGGLKVEGDTTSGYPPDWVIDDRVVANDEPGAFDGEENQTLPGVEPATGVAPPVADLPQQSLDLTAPPAPTPKQQPLYAPSPKKSRSRGLKDTEDGINEAGWDRAMSRPEKPTKPKQSLWDRLTDTGVPNDEPALRQWVADNTEKYQGEGWFKHVGEALDAGEVDRAASIAKMGVGQRGVLVLTVAPNDKAGFRRWMDKHAEEYSGEEWYDTAADAIENGDYKQAWRIASIASGRSMAAALGGNAARLKEREPLPKSADPIRLSKSRKAAVEKELGYSLPDTVDVSPEGMLTFDFGGKGVPAVKARATDLTLARTTLHTLTREMDPTHITYEEGNTNPNLRVNAQIADAIVRDFSEDQLSDILELTGIKDEVELGRQYRRAFSQAGRTLGQLGRWTQENKEYFYLLGGEDTVGSVGAKQAAPVTDSAGFLRWLGTGTEKDFEDVGFHLPRGVELKNAKGEITPEAKAYAKRWVGKQVKLAELGKTLGVLAEDGSTIDKAVAAVSIAPDLTAGRTGILPRAISLSKAFLISLPSTMIRNVWSQEGRYGFGMLDDTLAGTFSLAGGDVKGAKRFYTEAAALAKSAAAPGSGSSVNLYKRPWLDGMQAIYDFTATSVQGLPKNDVRHALGLISKFPQWENHFLGALSLEGERAGGQTWDSTLRNVITVHNRVQEAAFRGTVADAVMRAQLTDKGLDPNILADGSQALIDKLGVEEVDRMVGASVGSALDYTFAAPPLEGTIPFHILKWFNSMPVVSDVLQMVQPFPRFNFVSAPRWINDHMTAPIVDMPLMLLNRLRTDTSPVARGRYFQMLQRSEAGRTLSVLDGEIGRTEYDAAKHLQSFMAAKDQARQARTAHQAVEARVEKAGATLPEHHEELAGVRDTLQTELQAAEEARVQWRAAEDRLKNLTSQRDKAKRTYSGLQMVGAARSPEEYYARVATGMTMLGAAYMIRQHALENSKKDQGQSSANTKWYEFPVHIPDMGPFKGHDAVADLRSYSPGVQYLLPADFMVDLAHNTNWDEVQVELAGHTLGDWNAYSSAIKKGYHGKYTEPEAMKEVAQAFLSISPAAGSTRDLLDLITGRQAEGDTPSIQDVLFGTVGEFIGRFGTPFEQINQTVGQFRPESGKARIPVTGKASNPLHELADPLLAHVPGVREAAIPEKVSSITGDPIQTLDPLGRAFAGVTQRARNRVEQEITATGLPYAKAVPRVTGDREFDNAVAKAYGQILSENFQQVLDHEQYRAMNSELKRDVLERLFGELKKAAYGQVLATLPADQQQEKSAGPKTRDKRARWQKFAESELQEMAGPPKPPGDDPSVEPRPDAGPPAADF